MVFAFAGDSTITSDLAITLQKIRRILRAEEDDQPKYDLDFHPLRTNNDSNAAIYSAASLGVSRKSF